MLYQEIARIRVEEARQYCKNENVYRRTLKEKARNAGHARFGDLFHELRVFIKNMGRKAGFNLKAGTAR